MNGARKNFVLPVGVDTLCIPDNSGWDSTKLGLSIQCSPWWIGEPDGSLFAAELADWPSTIHGQETLQIFVTRDMRSAPVRLLTKTACITHEIMEEEGWYEQADTIWHKAFRHETGVATNFEPLWDKLRKRAEEKPSEAALSKTNLTDRRAAMIVDFIEKLRAAGETRFVRERMEQIWAKIDELVELDKMDIKDAEETLAGKPDFASTARLQSAINAMFEVGIGTLDQRCEDELVGMFKAMLNSLATKPETGGANKKFEGACPNPEESAELKLNAIMGVPSLAHFLGCGVYVDLDGEELVAEAGPNGYIAARFIPPNNAGTAPPKDALQWTAYAVKPGNALAPFAPREENSGGPNPTYVGEYLNLHQTQQGIADPRYLISQVSPEGTVLNEVVARHTMAAGGLKRDAMAIKDDIRRRGIALWDKESKQAEQLEAQRFVHETKANYLHDLVQGFRPDIQVDGEALNCPTSRSIRCEDREFPQAYYEHPFVEQFLLYRDHAWTQNSTITQGSPAKTEKHGTLFVYLGEPIGLGRDEEGASDNRRTVTTPKACEGLALKIVFAPDKPERLPDGTDPEQLKWPKLREGKGYFVGCRLAYVNGAGPGRDYGKVRDAYQAGIPTLGSDPTTAYPFEAVQVEPPRVLLHQFDRIVRRDRKNFPGSNANTIVLAHDDKQHRVVLPPAYAWDNAEQQGQFDLENDPSEVAAFGDDLLLASDGFSLPEARYRGLFFVQDEKAYEAVGGSREFDIGKESGTWVDERQSLGPVAHFTPATTTDDMYFVDKNALGFKVFVSDDVVTEIEYRDGGKPVPRVIAVKRVSRTNKLITVEAATNIDLQPGRGRTRLDGALIKIPAGRVIDVELRPKTSITQHLLRKTVVKIVSPIMQPVAPRDGRPVGVSGRYVDAADSEALEQKLRNETTPGKPDPLSTVALFEGNFDIDARATGKIVLHAAWQDWSATGWFADCVKKNQDGSCHRDNREFRFATKRQSVPLGTIDAEYEDGPDAWKPINLADCARDNGQRKVTHPFDEGLARAIDLTIQAESEFAPYYPSAHNDDLTSSTTLRVNFACTFRGKPLEIAFDDPILKWETTSFDPVEPNRGHLEGKRSEKRRIYLEGQLFVTGIDECVGVIVPRPEQLHQMANHEDFKKFVSESGIDPFFENGNQPARLEPGMLGGHIGIEKNVVIVINEGQENAGLGIADPFVSDVVLFDYKLDEVGRPYIEIDVSALAAMAHRPVLHLGMVRFQPHAMQHTETGGQKRVIDLRASRPIRKDLKLMPSRKYRWDYDRGVLSGWLEGPMALPENVALRRYAWARTDRKNPREWCWECVDADAEVQSDGDGRVIFSAQDLEKNDIDDADLADRLPDDFRTMFRLEEHETYKDIEAGTKGAKRMCTFATMIYPKDEHLPD